MESPEFIEGQYGDFQSARKHSWEVLYYTVPQTDTGGLVEKTKAIGRRMIKELGKKTGRNLWEMPCRV